MKKYLIFIAVILAGCGAQNLGATVLFPYQGGTGSGSVPTADQILIGDGSGVYTVGNFSDYDSQQAWHLVGDNLQPSSTLPILSPNGLQASSTVWFENASSWGSLYAAEQLWGNNITLGDATDSSEQTYLTLAGTPAIGTIRFDPNNTSGLVGEVSFDGGGAIGNVYRFQAATADTNFFQFLSLDTLSSFTANNQAMTFVYYGILGGGTGDRGMVMNNTGNDADFQVQGDNYPDLLYVDAGTDRVGIRTNTPAQVLDVNGITILKDALYFTQTDGNEHIDSPVDGVLRIVATDEIESRISNIEVLSVNAGLVRIIQDVDFAEGQSVDIETITATSATLGDDDYVILVDDDTAGSTVTITLPAAASHTGRVYHIKKLGTTASVIIDGNASETIDGATTAILTTQYESIQIVCDGSNWHII